MIVFLFSPWYKNMSKLLGWIIYGQDASVRRLLSQDTSLTTIKNTKYTLFYFSNHLLKKTDVDQSFPHAHIE